MKYFCIALVCAQAVACSHSAPPVAVQPKLDLGTEQGPAADEAGGFEEEASEHQGSPVPTRCDSAEGPCTPPLAFVEPLCEGNFPGAALALFAPQRPYTKAYIGHDNVAAYNTMGGASSSEKLLLGEEVLLLTASRRSIVDDGHVILRWDGTCAAVMSDEVTVEPRFKVTRAPIVWQYLDDNIQQALVADPAIRKARLRYRDACHGLVPSEQSSRECHRAGADFNETLSAAVSEGLVFPDPIFAPESRRVSY